MVLDPISTAFIYGWCWLRRQSFLDRKAVPLYLFFAAVAVDDVERRLGSLYARAALDVTSRAVAIVQGA